MMGLVKGVVRSGVAVAALACVLAACSSGILDSPSSSTPVSSSSSAFSQRMSRLFFGGGQEAQALAANAPDPTQDCPVADIRSGASTMRIPEGVETNASNLRYQATIARLARECSVRGQAMTIKVGVQGRIVLGAAGGPGQIEVPLRYAVIQEGAEPKTILTKLHRFPVAVGDGQTNVPFLHVEEDITFTAPPRSQLESYVVYVGFDPAAVREQQKPAKKGRAR